VLEVNFEEIKPLPLLPSNFFAPQPEATRWAACDHGAVWTLKERVQPQYPVSARMRHRQGTVLLYAVISEDGKLSGLKVAHSAGPELDQSAMTAVSHWRYERTAACSESKGRAETFVDVAYTLQD
jgi:TonB family protein